MISYKQITRIVSAMVFIGFFGFIHPVTSQADSEQANGLETVSKPLWEAGLFNVVARLPHYRGSDETTTYAFPLPYLIYRGEFFRMNQDGVKGIFLRTEFFEFDTSLYGNPPVDEHNQARSGMEELDPLFEIGPSLKWFPFGRKTKSAAYLKAAIRGVASIDFPGDLETQYQGVHGELDWIYQVSAPFGYRDWMVGCRLGVDITDKGYNRYFYEVPPQYARDDRPAYSAEGGYGGAKFSAYAGKTITPNIDLWAWFRWENVDGAVFEDSPLVREKNNFTLSLALSWTIFRSKQTVASHVDVYGE
jgi:outer membrane scaffolding protein for murein synthesis (MipA/OmpV family)